MRRSASILGPHRVCWEDKSRTGTHVPAPGWHVVGLLAMLALSRKAVTVAEVRSPNYDHLSGSLRPRWRGSLHAVAAFLTPFFGWYLLTLANSLSARIAGSVYSVSMLVCFGASGAYHRIARSLLAQRVMQRLDHGAIFLLVAGTYTPLLVLSFTGNVRSLLLALVWFVAVAGFVGRLTDRMRRSANVLYLVLGWSAVLLIPFMFHRLGALVMALLVAGGLVYTAGAVLFFLKRPRFSDRVFGFHEFWHSMTLLAGSAHYVAIALLFVRLG